MKDPIDSLDSFYEACKSAPVPANLVLPSKTPWWLRAAIPLGGLGFGGALALAIVTSPSSVSTQAGLATAQALAYRSLMVPTQRPASKSERAIGANPLWDKMRPSMVCLQPQGVRKWIA